MTPLFGTDDTTDAARARYTVLMRTRSAADRARILCGLNASVRRLAETGIRASHPHASDHEIRARLTARLYGDEFARRYFPDVEIG